VIELIILSQSGFPLMIVTKEQYLIVRRGYHEIEFITVSVKEWTQGKITPSDTKLSD
jgi:hypothetical protein